MYTFSGTSGDVGQLNANFAELVAALSLSGGIVAGAGGGSDTVKINTSATWSGYTTRFVMDYIGGASQYGMVLRTSAAGSSAALAFLNGGSANGVGTPTLVGSISCSTTATAYNTSSDRRLKTAIVDMPDKGAVIDALQPRQFEFLADPGNPVDGFIAQELADVVPAAVTPGDDGEEIERTWCVDYSRLVPLLVREVQSLRARVAALEAP